MDHDATAPVPLISFAYAAALIFIAFLYQSAWFRVRRNSSNKVSPWRAMAFHSGLFFVWTAFASRLTFLEHQSLTAHMIGHLLLSSVAAPLLLFGNPFAVLKSSSMLVRSPSTAQRNVSAYSPTNLSGALTHPLFCWISSVAVLLFWHIPPIFAVSMHNPPVHLFEKITFLLTGLLFWSPIIAPHRNMQWPRWTMPLYLLFATLPCDILSAFLVFCDRIVYTSYHGAHAPLFTSALADQQCAGALMWVVVTFIYLTPAVIITMNELRVVYRGNAPQLPSEADLKEVRMSFEELR
jgi:cytochrome c oxidase assembly factor CtaG